MTIKKFFLFSCCLQALIGVNAYSLSSAEIDKKVEKLLSQMTLTEKIGQLQQQAGEANGDFNSNLVTLAKKGVLGSTLNVRGVKNSNQLQKIALEESRLKIPILFSFDVIAGYQTVFPVPLAQASSWDLDLIEKIESTAALEAYQVGIKWTFAPMVDIARDPRWGRVVEGAGEDPYLGSQIARARVLGFQGKTLGEKNKIMACAKHWVAYGAAQAGREYNTTDISESELRNIYFPPFKAAVDAGAGTLMTAFNDLNGIPASANSFILNQVLNKEWNFNGFVVSDWNSVEEMVNHGYAANSKEAAFSAFQAGLTMEMTSQDYQKYLPELIQESRIKKQQLDDAVRRILRIKYKLGLFENPYISEKSADSSSQDYRPLAREAAAKSFVLLKNEKNFLPLQKDIKNIAVIGPLANDTDAALGWWRGDWPHLDQKNQKFREGQASPVISVLTGIQNKIPKSHILFSKGCELFKCTQKSITAAVNTAKKAKLAVVVVGESAEMSGEAASRTNIGLPGQQLELVKALHATGVPMVVVLMNGRPLAIPWIAENVPALLETWLGGQEAGNAVADILFGDQNPSGKLPMSFPRSVGQIPIYYNQKNTGRPNDLTKPNDRYYSKYIDEKNSPQFAFGYGLSYSKFKLSELNLSTQKLSADGTVQVKVKIENVGKRAGDEVVQLYIHQIGRSLTRPVKELKGFQRVSLDVGQTKNLEFKLGPAELGFFGSNMKFAVEPGAVEIFVGTSSTDGLSSSLEVLRH